MKYKAGPSESMENTIPILYPYCVLYDVTNEIDVIKKRISVRTYRDQEISEEEFDIIQKKLRNIEEEPAPFGNYSKFYILKLDKEESLQGVKLGTYGFIKGHMAYLVAVCAKEEKAIIDLGYSFEKVILSMTGKGLGTCWLGGTFSRESFMQVIDLEEGEFIGAVSPLGYAADKLRMKEKIIRRTAGSDHRKPWDQIFFKNDFSTGLKKDDAGELEMPLEMVRLGPSASNKQPWRLAVGEGVVHFYLDFDPKYAGNVRLGYPIQMLDIGIAMSHFELAMKSGNWAFQEPGIESDYRYIASWII